MAAITNAPIFPPDEYIARFIDSEEESACECVDGGLIQKSFGTRKHSQVQANVLTLIRSRHDESLNPLPELTTQLREHQFYIPDVAVEDLYKPIVILCIEVVSPPDRVGKLFGKCEEYHSWGVPDCWVIDPERKIAWEYFPADLEPRKVETALTAGSINLDLADVFWRV